MKKNFVWKKDLEFDSFGWLELGAPDCFNTGIGMVVAHDLLEHFAPMYGDYSIEDELLALGASLFIRGEQGYFAYRRYPSIPDQYSGEIAKCMSILHEKQAKWVVPVSHSIPCDEEIDECILQACKEDFGYLEDIILHESLKKYTKYLLRKGYRKASKRFHGNASQACNLFIQIERAVYEISEVAEEDDILSVSFDVTNFTYKVKRTVRNYNDDYS